MWVLDHLDDLASDFSAIHGIRDITAMSGPDFLRAAWRIGSYQGVMRDVLTVQAREEAEAAGPQTGTPGGGGGKQAIGGTRLELQSAPEFAGVFSFGSFDKAG